MGTPYLDAYNESIPKSEPQDEWEDRIRLYSMYISNLLFKNDADDQKSIQLTFSDALPNKT